MDYSYEFFFPVWSRVSHFISVVSISGKWTFSGSNWSQSSYWTMDIWSLSSLYQVFNVCFWCARGMKILWTFSVLIVFLLWDSIMKIIFSGHGCISKQYLQKWVRVSIQRGRHNLLCCCLPLLLGFLYSCCFIGVWELLIYLH